MLVCFPKHIPHHGKYEINDVVGVLIKPITPKYLSLALFVKVLQIKGHHLIDVVAEGVRLQLDDIVGAKNHVLDNFGKL